MVLVIYNFVASFGLQVPLLIGEYIPEEDERWTLYLQLMDIVDVVFT